MQSPDPAVASLAEAVILYHGGTLEVNVQQAVRVADCCAVSAANCKIVLFVASRKIKEASDPEGIFRALEVKKVAFSCNFWSRQNATDGFSVSVSTAVSSLSSSTSALETMDWPSLATLTHPSCEDFLDY